MQKDCSEQNVAVCDAQAILFNRIKEKALKSSALAAKVVEDSSESAQSEYTPKSLSREFSGKIALKPQTTHGAAIPPDEENVEDCFDDSRRENSIRDSTKLANEYFECEKAAVSAKKEQLQCYETTARQLDSERYSRPPAVLCKGILKKQEMSGDLEMLKSGSNGKCDRKERSCENADVLEQVEGGIETRKLCSVKNNAEEDAIGKIGSAYANDSGESQAKETESKGKQVASIIDINQKEHNDEAKRASSVMEDSKKYIEELARESSEIVEESKDSKRNLTITLEDTVKKSTDRKEKITRSGDTKKSKLNTIKLNKDEINTYPSNAARTVAVPDKTELNSCKESFSVKVINSMSQNASTIGKKQSLNESRKKEELRKGISIQVKSETQLDSFNEKRKENTSNSGKEKAKSIRDHKSKLKHDKIRISLREEQKDEKASINSINHENNSLTCKEAKNSKESKLNKEINVIYHKRKQDSTNELHIESQYTSIINSRQKTYENRIKNSTEGVEGQDMYSINDILKQRKRHKLANSKELNVNKEAAEGIVCDTAKNLNNEVLGKQLKTNKQVENGTEPHINFSVRAFKVDSNTIRNSNNSLKSFTLHKLSHKSKGRLHISRQSVNSRRKSLDGKWRREFCHHNGSSEVDMEFCIMQSVFLKYKSGVVEQYLERWCKLTKIAFSYYTTGLMEGRKALVEIPLSSVKQVKRVEASHSHKSLKLHQFQITLKPDFTSPQSPFTSLRKTSELPIPAHKDAETLTFHSPKKTSNMRSKGLLRRSKSSAAKDWTPESKGEELILVLDGARFESRKEKEEYRMYKEQHFGRLRAVFGRGEEVLNSPVAWSAREQEWPKTDRMLLFASESEETSNNWVSVFNWLLYKYYTH